MPHILTTSLSLSLSLSPTLMFLAPLTSTVHADESGNGGIGTVGDTGTNEPVDPGQCGQWIEHFTDDSAVEIVDGVSDNSTLPYDLFPDQSTRVDGVDCQSIAQWWPGRKLRLELGQVSSQEIRRGLRALALLSCENYINPSQSHNGVLSNFSLMPVLNKIAGPQRGARQVAIVYRYSPGHGTRAALSTAGKLHLNATVRATLQFNNKTPECTSGGCVGGSTEASVEFQCDGLNSLSSSLNPFFKRRRVEDELQEWSIPGPNVQDTLRRRVTAEHAGLCAGSTVSSWHATLQVWPPMVSGGSSGTAGGNVFIHSHESRLDRKVQVCIRAPQPAVGQAATIRLMFDESAYARSWVAGGAWAEAKGEVDVRTLKLVPDNGCRDCEADLIGTGLGAHDATTGVN
jgi:hypothetical protein